MQMLRVCIHIRRIFQTSSIKPVCLLIYVNEAAAASARQQQLDTNADIVCNLKNFLLPPSLSAEIFHCLEFSERTSYLSHFSPRLLKHRVEQIQIRFTCLKVQQLRDAIKTPVHRISSTLTTTTAMYF